VALRATAQDVAALEAREFVVLTRSPGPLSGGELIRFSVPAGLSTQQGLALARQLVPGAIIDFNHIYRPAQAVCDSFVCRQRRAIGWPQPPEQCQIETVIGMIDTTIDRTTPALTGQKISVLDAISQGRTRASSSHGTAIAALLVGRGDAEVPGLLPRGEIIAVQAFHTASNGEDIADTFDIVSAIDMLTSRGVPVINLSFAGPNNRVLAEIVSRSIASGAILVAAAGNKGPTGPVVYPAGYESVVAVTAVGEDLRVYRGANRGQYIDFAAPGVDVQVVSATVERKFESGTSFAAPFMSAAIAAARKSQPQVSAETLLATLQGSAADLGRPGRDPVFGWGLVQARDVCR
jgi:subtilisin family serine protease